MKRKLIALTLAVIMVLSLVTVVSAAENECYTIYVSPNGSDLNEGTFEKPLKSLEGAKNKVATLDNTQPITVVFRGGFYYQTEDT